MSEILVLGGTITIIVIVIALALSYFTWIGLEKVFVWLTEHDFNINHFWLRVLIFLILLCVAFHPVGFVINMALVFIGIFGL